MDHISGTGTFRAARTRPSPGDLTSIARDTHETLSQAVAGLIRRGLGSGGAGEMGTSARTGLPVAHLGRTITSEDARRLEDDDQ